VPAGEHLEEHESQRKQAGPVIDCLPARLLRGHVARGPEHDSRAGHGGHCRRVRPGNRGGGMMLPGQAEVEQLHAPVAGDEDVFRLQAAVDDALFVRPNILPSEAWIPMPLKCDIIAS